MALHVVGNVCVDDTFYVDRLPRPGETVNAVATARGVGGKGANQAVAAARTGAEVVFRAALGADSDAVFVRAALADELPLNGLVVLDTPTDRSTILVDRAGENIIVTAAASAMAFDPTELSSRPGKGGLPADAGQSRRGYHQSLLGYGPRQGRHYHSESQSTRHHPGAAGSQRCHRPTPSRPRRCPVVLILLRRLAVCHGAAPRV